MRISSNMKLLTRFCGLALAAALLTASTCAEAEVAAGPESAAAPAGAALADGQCQVAPVGYEGPCPLGALPAFFDDFRYTSGHTTRSVADAPRGDIFGENAWMTAEGEEVTRAWYRFNRDNHPVPGRISFNDGVMRLLVPAGTSAEAFVRSLILHTGATFHAGTYHYRVRLSPLWEGQQLRQTAWTMSHTMVFEQITADARLRFRYWSELDFENQNHFQGQRIAGRFVPDYMTTMSVGNHYGRLDQHPGHSRRLGSRGPVEPADGRGALAREGPATRPHVAPAPRVDSWADTWLDLRIDVDDRGMRTTYWMKPADADPALARVAQRPMNVGEAFFPRQPMHFAFSLHWVEPSGRLQNDLWMDVDWIYHSPVSGLSRDDVVAQVDLLRARGHQRVNTTASPTFRDLNVPLEALIDGPDALNCGEHGNWRLRANRAAPLHATFRFRVVHADGRASAWQNVNDYDLRLRPQRNVQRIQLEGTLTDRWRPHGRVIDAVTGWESPQAGNESSSVRHSVTITCPG